MNETADRDPSAGAVARESRAAAATSSTSDTNRVGLTKSDYEGAKTPLCPGCGHNAITAGIIQAAYESSLEPHRVAKLSGIGCSSKTPAYFLGHAHGFNAVHGRMPSIATGVRLAMLGIRPCTALKPCD